MLESDLFHKFPCDGKLILVEARSTERGRLFWCSGCATEFTFTPDSTWVWVVYPGMKSELEVLGPAISENARLERHSA